MQPKNRQANRNNLHRFYGARSQRGEGLIGGVAGTILFIAIALPVGIFFVNVAIQLTIQSQLSHIANQAAIVVDAHRYWLGLPRPGFNAAEAEQKADKAARTLCQAIGLPPLRVDVQLDPPGSDPDIRITQVDVTVDITRAIPFRINLFGYDFGKLFPTALAARGVSANANVRPYALMHFEAPATVDGDQRGSNRSPVFANNRETAFIPVYAFGLKSAAGQKDTVLTRYDHPDNHGDLTAQAQQLSNPENFISFNHYNLIKEDLTALNTDTLKQLPLSGWHGQRFFGSNLQPNAPGKAGVGLTP